MSRARLFAGPNKVTPPASAYFDVLERVFPKHVGRYCNSWWRVKCRRCGDVRVMNRSCIRLSRSCGCLARTLTRERNLAGLAGWRRVHALRRAA